MLSLADILAAKRKPPRPIEAFPLKSLLALYSRANRNDVYVDYFDGFLYLLEWLKPFSVPEYPISQPSNLLHTYEVNEIAKLTGTPVHIVYRLAIELEQEYYNDR